MSITSKLDLDVEYRFLMSQVPKVTDRLRKSVEPLGNLNVHLNLSYNSLNKGKKEDRPGWQALINEKNACSVIFSKHKTVVEGALYLEKEVQRLIQRVNLRIPMSDADKDDLADKKKKLEEIQTEIRSLRKKVSGQLSTIEPILKLFHAIVANRGDPLGYVAFIVAKLSPLPSLAASREWYQEKYGLEVTSDPSDLVEEDRVLSAIIETGDFVVLNMKDEINERKERKEGKKV
jgi:hypothetical protein